MRMEEKPKTNIMKNLIRSINWWEWILLNLSLIVYNLSDRNILMRFKIWYSFHIELKIISGNY